MSWIARLLLLAACGLFLGCGTSVQWISKDPTVHRPPRAVESVETLTEAPKRPYKEGGVIYARQRTEYSLDDEATILAAMKTEAAQFGCDAMFITNASNQATGSIVPGSNIVRTISHYRAKCLVWTGDSKP